MESRRPAGPSHRTARPRAGPRGLPRIIPKFGGPCVKRAARGSTGHFCRSLAKTPSASPFKELCSCAGYPNRRQASLVARHRYRHHRAGMLNRALAVARTLLAIFASRADLILENLALRQQLAVLRRKHPRPRLCASDRVFWLALRRCWPRWKETLAIVQPETVIRWHREGFRRCWRWKSRRHAGRPSTAAEIRALVRRMAAENPAWGAPRIHGEIQKFGLEVSERPVSRYMPRRPVDPESRQRWRTFLSNHRELLDHVPVLNAKQLQRPLAEFAGYYHDGRTHLSLAKDAPAIHAVESKPNFQALIVAHPRLGGLHHRYAWRAAA